MEEEKKPHIEAEQNEETMTMADLLGAEKKVEQRATIKAKVISSNADGLLVDLGTKTEGIILKGELESSTHGLVLKPGSEVEVEIVSRQSEYGYPVVSFKNLLARSTWDKVLASNKVGTSIDGVITKKIKGGYIVDIGMDAFLPESQLELRPVRNHTSYIGQSFSFIIVELNSERKNVVLSRRKLLEVEEKSRIIKVLEILHEDQIVEGKVKSITKFGAFIDVGGIDGLVHISDLTWFHVKSVNDVLKIGQTVSAKVLKIDRTSGKVSLGLKHTSPRPWASAEERFPIGLVVKGTVKSVVEFGVFVELEPGLEGLIHQSEVEWNQDHINLKKLFNIGQEIEAKIISLDIEKEKLGLSLKRMKTNPWDEAQKQFPIGTKTKATITKMFPFGVFAKLADNVEGLIKVSDISWEKVRNPKDVLKVGDVVEVVVTEISSKAEKISISIKNVTEDPLKKYKNGKVVSGEVKRIVDFGAFVELEPKIEALLRIGEIAAKRLEKVEEAIQVGQTIEAKIIKVDTKERKIDISIKKLDMSRERDLVKKYANRDDRPTLGDILESDE